jgi:leucyl aminopeptidase
MPFTHCLIRSGQQSSAEVLDFGLSLGTRGLMSAVSAVQNAGNKYAGSITAALFLQQYVDTEKVQWAHIDIAGYGLFTC